jgi:hypothetical protein
MPHRTGHCEIIPVRVDRAASTAEPSPYPHARTPAGDPGRSLMQRWEAMLGDGLRCFLLHYSDTSREPSGSIWCLFLSTIQGSTSRFASPLLPQTALRVLYMPQNAPVRCHCDIGPCPTCRTARATIAGPQAAPPGDTSAESPYIGVTYPGTNFGDFTDEGLQACRLLLTLSPTCAPSSSRRLSALPQEPCVDGESMAWDLPLSRPAGLFGIGRKTWSRGHKRLTERPALENADTASLPCRGERRVGSKLRRGDAPPRSASHTVHPTSREVPVTPTLARRSPQGTHHPCMVFSTSPLISPGLVTQ